MENIEHKNEWKQLYECGKLYMADENGHRLEDIYFPILKIIRDADTPAKKEYVIRSEDGTVEIHCHADAVRELSRSVLSMMAGTLYEKIKAGGRRAFEIDEADQIMKDLGCSQISAPSSDKTDITMQVHDIHTGYHPICGFSIKSELGSAPTLLNASGATNFVYEVIGLTEQQAKEVNAIQSNTKIIDRIDKIFEQGSLAFRRAKNSVFKGNLMLIDTYMENIVGDMLLDYYQNNVSSCEELTERLERRNPIGYPRKGLYRYKVKRFLWSSALGMMPSKAWDGCDEANGGYIIVKYDGDVVAYHIYNRAAFENYLLKHTKFERASTARHDFASVYRGDDGKMYMNPNLQIRFT